MARSEAERPVLRFPLPGVRSHQGLRWILWPALAWRVIAPRPRARKLNVLQRAVLGLCAAGLARAEDIGEKLMIGRDLAAHILEELRGAGWVNARHQPTTQGRSALQEDMGEPIEDMTVGWVFTDPFSGQVWPRFHSGELPMAAVERDRGPKPMLLSGTIGDPRRDMAFQVHVRSQDQTQGARPQAEEVLRAARAHRKQHDWEEQALVPDPPAVQRVSFVLEEPTDCLLATRVWLAAPGDWKIDDPFGIGQSLRLRRWIEERLDTDRGLRDWLEPILGGDPTSTSFASLGQQAEWLVEERLTTAIRTRRDLRDRLVAMQRTLLETALDDCPEDRWDDVAVKAQRAAERAFPGDQGRSPPARSGRLRRGAQARLCSTGSRARSASRCRCRRPSRGCDAARSSTRPSKAQAVSGRSSCSRSSAPPGCRITRSRGRPGRSPGSSTSSTISRGRVTPWHTKGPAAGQPCSGEGIGSVKVSRPSSRP